MSAMLFLGSATFVATGVICPSLSPDWSSMGSEVVPTFKDYLIGSALPASTEDGAGLNSTSVSSVFSDRSLFCICRRVAVNSGVSLLSTIVLDGSKS